MGKMKRRRMKCRRDDSLTKKKRRNGRYKFTTAFSIFEICGAYLRVTGETITYTRSRIDPSVHFQSKGYSQIGHRVKIHLLLQYMNDFIFPSRLASHCEEKYQQSLLHICPVYSRVGLVECLLFFCLHHLFTECVCVCANSCLLNIIGISARGLIKKQLPLVAVGEAWRGVAPLIW